MTLSLFVVAKVVNQNVLVEGEQMSAGLSGERRTRREMDKKPGRVVGNWAISHVYADEHWGACLRCLGRLESMWAAGSWPLS